MTHISESKIFFLLFLIFFVQIRDWHDPSTDAVHLKKFGPHCIQNTPGLKNKKKKKKRKKKTINKISNSFIISEKDFFFHLFFFCYFSLSLLFSPPFLFSIFLWRFSLFSFPYSSVSPSVFFFSFPFLSSLFLPFPSLSFSFFLTYNLGAEFVVPSMLNPRDMKFIINSNGLSDFGKLQKKKEKKIFFCPFLFPFFLLSFSFFPFSFLFFFLI